MTDEDEMYSAIWGSPVAGSDLASAASGAEPPGPPVVQVDAALFASMQASATFAADHAGELANLTDVDRDAFLAGAVADGRVAPASVPAWRESWHRDRAGTVRAVSALPAVLAPVSSVVSDAGYSEADWDAFGRSIGMRPSAPQPARLAALSDEDNAWDEFFAGTEFRPNNGGLR
jgi:hypothetical protein